MDDVPLTKEDQTQHLKIGSMMTEGLKRRLIDFPRSNSDCFAWSHADMPGIDPKLIMHKLQVDHLHQPVIPKRRKFSPERDAIINDEVKSLLGAGFIREVQYPEWLANIIVVNKNGKWRVFKDFTDLNKSYKIGRTMEVYIDDMLVKSLEAEDLISHLHQAFSTLWKYNLKLNPAKCPFGVSSGKFLGYIVTHRGIEANPEQIRTIPSIPSPKNVKEVQKLTGRMAALSRFISRLSEKSHAFFGTLKNPKDFQRTEECESALHELKAYLTTPPLLSKQLLGEVLLLYLAVSENAARAVLVREDGSKQLLIYYVSKALLDAETRYSHLEKLALALATNNESEYEALIAGLTLAHQMGAENIQVFVDSQLIINQAKDAQTYDVEDIESEPEPDKEAPDGAARAESPMIAHLHQMFFERLDAIQSMVERLPGVAPPIRKSNPDSYADTPFTDEITLIEMPKKFSFPSIKAYDGTTDPDDHVAQYKQRMLAVALPKGSCEATMCKGSAPPRPDLLCNGISTYPPGP
ncbi:PREDICTED: uncharacterized protein LOC106344976 [Brassica oleracea var. oleracea]|uniref:uncharacterized protein LOC106344976 n=1 Tax=Brassica oleracea var. oleracea TaxID=109376 RepID=UPI0006A73A32|nr:PREDICTED: uncharacterized protein LOC106344976 [Brassica oleracea var. oleracea]